jgi:predicted lipoprotein with Yx(FWY)xxD motif
MLIEYIHPVSGRKRLTYGRTGLAVLVAATLSVVLAACAQAKPAAKTPARNAGGQSAVFARALTGIGTTLVTRSGRTIYSPEQEAAGKITCTGSCLTFWFPVTARPGATLTLPAGFTGKLGTVHRPDNGQTQLTYNGKPLYTFRLDTAAGQAHGNNFTDHFGSTSFTWRAITVANGPKTKSNPTPASGGYSYSSPSTGY